MHDVPEPSKPLVLPRTSLCQGYEHITFWLGPLYISFTDIYPLLDVHFYFDGIDITYSFFDWSSSAK